MASSNNSKTTPARRWFWIALVLIAAVFIFSYSRRTPIRIRTTVVDRGPIRSLVSTNGKIEPVLNFEAHSPIATTVKRLLVKEGDHVRKGQLLLELDDADIRAQAARARARLTAAQADQAAFKTGGSHEEVLTLDSQLTKARSDLALAQRNLDSLRRLQQEGAASPAEVRQAEDTLQRAQADITLLQQKQKGRYSQPEVAKGQADVTEAQAAYEAASDAMKKSNVRAPFDGIVYSLPVKQGAFVQAGELLLQQADLSRVVARVFVDEPDVGRIAVGEKVEVTWDAVPGRTWTGIVATVPSTVKLRGARNVGEATCTVDNHDLRLLPNVNVGVAIVTAEHANVLTLQREALRIDDSKPYVYQVVDEHLQRRNVEIALQNLTSVEIVSGLTEGAVVAISSDDPKPMTDGAAIKVVR